MDPGNKRRTEKSQKGQKVEEANRLILKWW